VNALPDFLNTPKSEKSVCQNLFASIIAVTLSLALREIRRRVLIGSYLRQIFRAFLSPSL